MIMQVDFDRTYFETEQLVHKDAMNKKSRMNTMKSHVISVCETQGTDFKAINDIYREVFNYLITFVDAKKNKDVEREIAAALESVLPKIGLKSFLQLNPEEQRQQLTELASIVNGIRLFNKQIGKGGAGILDVVSDVKTKAASLLNQLEDSQEALEDLCTEYSTTIVYAQKCEDSPSVSVLNTWRQELANRHQFLAFVKSLESNVHETVERMEQLQISFASVIDTLQDLVGSKNSVAKDQVYPKFDALSELFLEQQLELDMLNAREKVWKMLKSNHLDNMSVTLGDKWSDLAMESDDRQEGKHSEEEYIEEKSQLEKVAVIPRDGIELLTPESTPESLTLRLEFQGFCPTSAATRNGLLFPGKPQLGVVKYNGTYAAFHTKQARDSYLRNPQAIIDQLLEVARVRSDLIPLMELNKYFTSVFSQLVRGSSSGLGGGLMVDAGTETPLHFVEKHIDANYEWNEWSLRRKAIQLVNLRKAKTTSTQTLKSHFRRDNESQVYLPKNEGTNTGINRGTNPPRTLQYITGLRGLSNSKFVRREDEKRKGSKALSEGSVKALPGAARVVNMTFEF